MHDRTGSRHDQRNGPCNPNGYSSSVSTLPIFIRFRGATSVAPDHLPHGRIRFKPLLLCSTCHWPRAQMEADPQDLVAVARGAQIIPCRRSRDGAAVPNDGPVYVLELSCSTLVTALPYDPVSSDLEQVTLSNALVTHSTLPATWSSLGCYTYVPAETPLTCTLQTTGVRTLGGASYTDNAAMTDESCTTYCTNKSYIYAGSEYASECCEPSISGGVKSAPFAFTVS